MDAVYSERESGGGKHKGVGDGNAGGAGFDVNGPDDAFC